MKALLLRVAAQPFEVAIALAATGAGLLATWQPVTSGSVHVVTPGLARLWGAMYALAGIATVAGVITARVGIEVFGLLVLAGAIFAGTITSAYELDALRSFVTILTRASFGVAAVGRAWLLWRRHDTIVVSFRNGNGNGIGNGIGDSGDT